MLRWASLIFGIALGLTTQQPDKPAFYIAGAVLLANTIFRTIRPLRLHPATWRAEAMLLLDLARRGRVDHAHRQLGSPLS